MGLDLPATPPPPLTSFYGLQVTNFDVLLNSAPNGPDYIDILVLCLHAQLFRSNVRSRMGPTDPVVANILIALPLFEIAPVRVRLNHVARFIVNAIGNSGRRARSNNGEFRIFAGVGQRENRCKNEYLLGTATTRLELGLKNP
jgi:hypothetical protein